MFTQNITKASVDGMKKALAEVKKDKHTKGATPPESQDNNLKGKGAKDMMKPAKDAIKKPAVDEIEMVTKDAAKMTANVNLPKSRKGDNLNQGDIDIVGPGTKFTDPAMVKPGVKKEDTKPRWISDVLNERKKKKLDPVDKDELKGDHDDREDGDIDNDGDEDESDKFLHKKRKAISKKMKKENSEDQIDELSMSKLSQYKDLAKADISRRKAKMSAMPTGSARPEKKLEKRKGFKDLAKAKMAYKSATNRELGPRGPGADDLIGGTSTMRPSGPNIKKQMAVTHGDYGRNISPAKKKKMKIKENIISRLTGGHGRYMKKLQAAHDHHDTMLKAHSDMESHIDPSRGSDPDKNSDPDHQYVHGRATESHLHARNAIKSLMSKAKKEKLTSHPKGSEYNDAKKSSAEANENSRKAIGRDRDMLGRGRTPSRSKPITGMGYSSKNYDTHPATVVSQNFAKGHRPEYSKTKTDQHKSLD